MTTIIYGLLRQLAAKQNSAQINFAEFSEYMRRYAQHHLAENPNLIVFQNNPTEALTKEITKLENSHKAYIASPDTDKTTIVVVAFYADKFTLRFKEIQNNISIPFPVEADLPKNIPLDIFEKKTASEFLVQLITNPPKDDSSLFGLVFPHELPVMLLPSSITMETLLDLSISKIRLMLRKEEFHDYFLKKIRISNPGKELAAKNFFTTITTKPSETLELIKTSSDSFYFWNQLCYFIRQDFEKVKDYTQEDLCLLQSVCVAEIAITYYKNKAQKDIQRETALRYLETTMNRPPYYFNKDDIINFVDAKGIPLLGQYTEQDLNDFLHKSTTSMEKTNLPDMLVFKLENDMHYFIYKSKVIPLVIRLCNDARDVARDKLTKEWHQLCRQFETSPAMKDQKAFNDRLEQIVRQSSPILYSLLSSNFLSLVHYEARTNHESSVAGLNIFSNGKLQPYSELLMLSRQEILTDAKILLPFWYTIPIISWIAKLFIKKPTAKNKNKKSQKEVPVNNSPSYDNEELPTNKKDISRKQEFINAAKEIETHIVPMGSSIDRELNSYEHQWNPLIDKKARQDLTEDVNSLIRDYLRKILRTSKANNFSIERIRNLAETLCNTPNLQKIKEQDQLNMYVQLYMIKLVKNL